MKNILEKVLSGIADANIRFAELRKLVLSLGFKERIKGDHYIYSKTGIIEIIPIGINNIQPLNDGKARLPKYEVGGQAKPYIVYPME